MTIFKSRQVNLDPEPWVNTFGNRVRSPGRTDDGEFIHAPRTEFEATRDPLPWAGGSEVRYPDEDCARYFAGEARRWAPRREQFDTPVNLILQEVRLDVRTNEVSVKKAALDALRWVRLYAQPGPFEGSDEVVGEVSAEMLDHARRVLTRLANWKEQ